MIERTLECVPGCAFVLMTTNLVVNNPSGNVPGHSSMHAEQRPRLVEYYEVPNPSVNTCYRARARKDT